MGSLHPAALKTQSQRRHIDIWVVPGLGEKHRSGTPPPPLSLCSTTAAGSISLFLLFLGTAKVELMKLIKCTMERPRGWRGMAQGLVSIKPTCCWFRSIRPGLGEVGGGGRKKEVLKCWWGGEERGEMREWDEEERREKVSGGGTDRGGERGGLCRPLLAAFL